MIFNKRKVFFISKDVLFFEVGFPFHAVKDKVDNMPTENFLGQFVLPCSPDTLFLLCILILIYLFAMMLMMAMILLILLIILVLILLLNLNDVVVCIDISRDLDAIVDTHVNTPTPVMECPASTPTASNDTTIITISYHPSRWSDRQ